MQSNDYFLTHMKEGEEPWLWVVAASLLAHVLLFAFVLFFPFPSASMSQFHQQEVIEVDLAAIDAQTPAPPAAVSPESPPPQEENPADDSDYAPEAAPEAKEPQKEPQEKAIPVKKAPEKRFDPSDYVVEKPGPKVKHSMKKQSVRTAAVHRSAVERLKERADDARPRSVAERISSLKSQVEGQSRKLSDQGEANSRRRGGTVRDMSQIEIYQAEVAVRLKNNWVFSENLAGETQGLESQLVIKILEDGSITDVWYAKRSGNSYLDESAHKTVMKSDPLPPLPEGYSDYHLMVGFTPSGLRR